MRQIDNMQHRLTAKTLPRFVKLDEGSRNERWYLIGAPGTFQPETEMSVRRVNGTTSDVFVTSVETIEGLWPASRHPGSKRPKFELATFITL